jgi:hypothetical protein
MARRQSCGRSRALQAATDRPAHVAPLVAEVLVDGSYEVLEEVIFNCAPSSTSCGWPMGES